MGAVNVQELKIGLGKVAQAAIGTANISADFFSIPQVNQDFAAFDYAKESDADDIGKGDEFATQTFNSHVNVSKKLDYYCSSEMLAFMLAYGLGSSAATTPAAGAYTHTATFQDPVASGIELPLFSIIEQLRPSGSPVVLDQMYLDNVVEEFQVDLASGPGRQNSKLAISCVGSGKITAPSAITLPALTAQHLLNAASATITIIGTNVVTAKTIDSLSFGVKNNIRLDTRFFPGSGQDANGFAIGARMEFGKRQPFLKFVARFKESSPELAALVANTTGTVVLTLQGALITGATYHSFSWTLQKGNIQSAVLGNSNGIVTVSCDVLPMKHATNGVLTAFATNTIPLFGKET